MSIGCDEENFSSPEECCLQPIRFISPRGVRLVAHHSALAENKRPYNSLKQVLLVVWLLICSLLRTFAKKIEKTMLKVEIINRSHHALPTYATPLSAGMDLRANLTEPIVLKPLARCIVPTGLFIALPEGYEAQVRPRSGLAIKKGITVLNSPGTVDADYRGEVGVILVNLSSEDFVIEDGERIAQMVIARHEQVEWEAVEVLSETERGAGGFGHTGV